MDWYCLGHACWLVEAAGLRLLFDPVLGHKHHSGVFEVRPRREIDAEALRADFVLISHRHADHFDVPSLHRLARIDPEMVVVTPDELVAWAARRLGFRTVHLLPPAQRVDLDGVRIVTTPSVATLEWGAVVETDDAVAWNQVDTVPATPPGLGEDVQTALVGLGRPAGTRLDLALMAWQPLLEIAAVTAGATGFPVRRYAQVMEQVAAVGARTVVPTACGQCHVGPSAWLDEHGYPVSESRFLRDVSAYCPDLTALPGRVGGRYRISGGAVDLSSDAGRGLVQVETGPAPFVRYAPFEIPPVVDPQRGTAPVDVMREVVREFVEGTLADEVGRAWPSMGLTRVAFLCVEVVWPDVVDAYTLRVGPEGVQTNRRLDPEWDVLDRVAGSLFYEVIEGRWHWGDVLLGGFLRATSRAYHLDDSGCARPANVGTTFLYYGLPYDRSVERAVRHFVSNCT